MSLMQLIYASHPFGFDEAILSHILIQARANNHRDGITGALICRADIYLQLLEGPEPAIAAVYQKIQADDRHLEIRKLLQRPVLERMFPDWAMKDDPAYSWMWDQNQVSDGAVDRASQSEILAVFERVRDQF